jgi:hypothetical protein
MGHNPVPGPLGMEPLTLRLCPQRRQTVAGVLIGGSPGAGLPAGGEQFVELDGGAGGKDVLALAVNQASVV